MKLQIYPSEILLKPTTDVVEFDEELEKLANQLQAIMKASGGCGLGANQVGVDKSVFVTPTKVFVNPEIIEYNGEVKYREGCLSFPTIQVTVTRAEQIEVRYFNIKGEKQLETLEGFDAIVFQHEYDHLQGKTLLNHVGPVKRDTILRKLRKWKKKNL